MDTSGPRINQQFLAVGSIFLTATSLAGLLFQKSFCWLLCPQALLVMFIRQSQHAYDSLGAVSLPDLITALLYYPYVSWIVWRRSRAGKTRRTVFAVLLFHLVTIAAAYGAANFRNYVWASR